MASDKFLGITINNLSNNQILEKIGKYIQSPDGFFHIVSLNPENLVISRESNEFKRVIEKAQIKIIDGVGIVLAAKILGLEVGDRWAGIDLMRELLSRVNDQRLRVLLIGAKEKVALELANCYSGAYSEAKFMGSAGIQNIQKPRALEEERIFSIVTSFKPHILFAAFGSPYQELWLSRHRDKLKGIICMGVGGAFDYELGRISRAPQLLRSLGLEWLFRLLRQPWRWKRQVKLIKFVWLVLRARLTRA